MFLLKGWCGMEFIFSRKTGEIVIGIDTSFYNDVVYVDEMVWDALTIPKFFGLIKDALESGIITKEEIKKELSL